MIVRCPKCKVKIKIDDSRVTNKGVKLRCPKCQYIFSVRRKQEAQPTPIDDQQAIRSDQPATRNADVAPIVKEQEQAHFYKENRPKRVMIAEDTAFFRKMLSDLLSNAGYEVLTATDGEEALQMLKHELPDVDILVLDLQLPKISGFELLKKLRSAKLSQHLPVLAMTGVHKKAEEVMLVRKLGATGYISKSNNPEHFLFRIKQILEPEDNDS